MLPAGYIPQRAFALEITGGESNLPQQRSLTGYPGFAPQPRRHD